MNRAPGETRRAARRACRAPLDERPRQAGAGSLPDHAVEGGLQHGHDDEPARAADIGTMQPREELLERVITLLPPSGARSPAGPVAAPTRRRAPSPVLVRRVGEEEAITGRGAVIVTLSFRLSRRRLAKGSEAAAGEQRPRLLDPALPTRARPGSTRLSQSGSRTALARSPRRGLVAPVEEVELSQFNCVSASSVSRSARAM